jgi:hypothetical protein
LPSVIDLLARPVAAEIRPAPKPISGLPTLYVGDCPTPASRAAARDGEDPPRMIRVLATTTASSSIQTYTDCQQFAVVTGQPYAVDVRVWDAESGTIIEVLNHDYEGRFVERRRPSRRFGPERRLLPGN